MSDLEGVASLILMDPAITNIMKFADALRAEVGYVSTQDVTTLYMENKS